MKRFFVTLAAGAMLLGCANNDTPISDWSQKESVEPVRTADELLSLVDGVTIIKDTVDADQASVTYFYYDQPIDHSNAAAGTFRQYCVLHYKGADHVTVLHTQGYSTADRKVFKQVDLAKNLDANYIEVEHRYFRNSAINKGADYFSADYWQYNTAAQSTADLHRVVTALKATGCFKNKWVSTGVSKNGMLTALYAYYYPNEMDVYVPFCAPFCTEQESLGIGKWLTEECGKDEAGQTTELQNDIWKALQRMATDENLKVGLAGFYRQQYRQNRFYNDTQALCAMVYKFMENMFVKFAYFPTDTWDDVIPRENSSAELYFRFADLGKVNYRKKLRALRELWQLEDEQNMAADYESDTYDDYETEETEWVEMDGEESAATTRASMSISYEKILPYIYHVHAAKELGYFLFDWSKIPANTILPPTNFEWFKKNQSSTRYNKTFDVTYDNGKLMKDFLGFVKNNSSNARCKMLFVYGGNDPWTGAAIPDPAAGDACVKKYIVHKGVHSGSLNNSRLYPASDKEYIINTVKEWLK